MGSETRPLAVLRDALLAAALVVALAGCRSAPTADDPDAPRAPTYWQRRRDELARSFEFLLHFGPGLGFRVTATRWAQLGALAVGPVDDASRITPPLESAVGLHAGDVGTFALRQAEWGVSPWYASDASLRPIPDHGAATWRGDLAATRGTQLGAQVHLALVGVTVGFDPVAFGELLLGLVGLRDETAPVPPAADPASAASADGR